MNEYNKKLIREILIRILFVIIIVSTIILLVGCSSNDLRFNTYAEVTSYCYNQSFNKDCDVEKCVMINSAIFNNDVKFTAEKNYYQCKLLGCNTK